MTTKTNTPRAPYFVIPAVLPNRWDVVERKTERLVRTNVTAKVARALVAELNGERTTTFAAAEVTATERKADEAKATKKATTGKLAKDGAGKAEAPKAQVEAAVADAVAQVNADTAAKASAPKADEPKKGRPAADIHQNMHRYGWGKTLRPVAGDTEDQLRAKLAQAKAKAQRIEDGKDSFSKLYVTRWGSVWAVVIQELTSALDECAPKGAKAKKAATK